MGNWASHDSEKINAYKQHAKLAFVQRGSCDTQAGGELETQDISKFIIDVAKSLSTLFPQIKTENKSISDIITQIRDTIPDFLSQTNTKTIVSDQQKQKQIVTTIANIINTYDKGAIAISDNHEQMAKSTAMYLTKVISRIATMYTNLATSIKQDINSVKLLLKLLSEIGNIDRSKYEESDNVVINEAIKKFTTEANLLMQKLEGLITIYNQHFQEDIDKLLGDENVETIINRLKQKTAMPSLAAYIMLTLSKFREMTLASHIVLNALKRLNISVEEYNKASSLDDIRELAADKLLKILESPITKDDLHKLKIAYEYLTTRSPTAIEHMRGSYEEEYGKSKEEAYNLLLSSFVTKLLAVLSEIKNKIKILSKDILKYKIKNISCLTNIARILSTLYEFDTTRLLNMLSGYRATVDMRQEQEIFISNIRHIISYLNTLAKEKGDASSLFDELKDLFNKLINVINTYTERFTGKKQGGAVEPDMNLLSLVQNLNTTKDKLIYYIKLATLYNSLLNTSEEMLYFSNNYTEVLGKVVAEKRDIISKEFKMIKEKIEKDKAELPQNYKHNIKVLDILLEHFEKVRIAKSNLWETAEAVDLYLKDFTLKFHQNPQRTLVTLAQILNLSEIVGSSLTKNTKTFFWKIMEDFPFYVNSQNIRYYTKLSEITPAMSQAHYYVLTAVMCNMSSLIQLRNTGITEDMLSDADYATLRAACYNQADNTPVLGGNPLFALPIMTFTTTEPINNYELLTKKLKALFKNPSIKNILSLVFSIGDSSEEKQILGNIFMSKKQMYQNLINYMHYSSFIASGGVHDTYQNTLNNNFDNIFHGKAIVTGVPSSYDATFMNWGAFTQTKATVPAPAAATEPQNTKISVQALSNLILRPIDEYNNTYNSQLFVDTDFIFVKIFKAFVAKILTFINYTVTASEPKYSSNLTYNSTMRQVLGAGEENQAAALQALPTDGAFVELVVRLPLMVELYKDIFDFGENEKFKFIVLSDMTSKFHRLFEIIQYSELFQNEVYPDDVMNALLLELKNIYDKYTDKDPMKILADLMIDYNKRVTLVSQDYIKEANKALRDRFKLMFSPDYLVDYDYPLKSVDDEIMHSFKLAPSSSYVKDVPAIYTGLNPKLEKKLPKMSLQDYINCIREKRVKAIDYINAYAPNVENKELNFYTLNDYVVNVKHDIENSNTQEDKIRILKQILNEGNSVNIYNNYVTAAFNELVAAPIEHLNAAYNIFDNIVTGITEMYDEIRKVENPAITRAEIDRLTYKLSNNDFINKPNEYAPDLESFENNRFTKSVDAPLKFIEFKHMDGFPIKYENFMDFVFANLGHGPNQTNAKLMAYLHELVQRYALDTHQMFLRLYEILQSINTWTKYATVDRTGDKWIVDLGNPVADIKELFVSVKKYIHYFKPHVNKEIYNKFILNSKSEHNMYSYQWLEVQFLEDLILDNVGNKHNKLLQFNDRVNYIYNFLTKKWRYNSRVRVLPHAAGVVNNNAYSTYVAAARPAGIVYEYTSPNSIQPAAAAAAPVAALLVTPAYSGTTINLAQLTSTDTYGVLTLVTLTAVAEQDYNPDNLQQTLQLPTLPNYLIGIPNDYDKIIERSFNNIRNLHDITEHGSYNNYMNEIMQLLYINAGTINYIMTNLLKHEYSDAVVGDLNYIYGFVYNKSSKKLHNVDLDKSLIPNIFKEYNSINFINFYHGNGVFYPHSQRSLIISFNQLLNLLISNCLYAPFDKIAEDVIMGVLTELKDEIGNFDKNLPNVLTYASSNDKQGIDAAYNIVAYANVRTEATPIIDAITAARRPAFDVARYFKAASDVATFKRHVNEGFYTSPLYFDYWSNSILCQTLSAALYQITQAKSKNDEPLFLVNSQADISQYYKERLKTFIPLFLCYAKTLLERTKLFSKYVDPLKIKVTTNNYAYTLDTVMWEHTPPLSFQHGKVMIATRVSKISQSLVQIVDKLNKFYQQLHDEYSFGELTIKESASDRLILPSMVLMTYRDINKITYDSEDDILSGDLFVPQHPLNDPRQKIQCALRGFFNGDLSIEKTSIKDIVQKFTAASVSEIGDYTQFYKYFMQSCHYFGFMINCVQPFFTTLIQNEVTRIPHPLSYFTAGTLSPLFDYMLEQKKVCSQFLTRKVTDIVSIYETKTKANQYFELLKQYSKLEYFKTRNNFRVFNVLDTNIGFINMYAFMRDTPLCNVIIYSEAFEDYVTNILSRPVQATMIGHGETTYGGAEYKSTTSPTNLFKTLLMEPYTKVEFANYLLVLKEMIRGNIDVHNTMLPKFIDHDIYENVLFGELVKDTDNYPLEHNRNKVFVDTQNPIQYARNELNELFLSMCKEVYSSHNIILPQSLFFPDVTKADNVFRNYAFKLIKNILFGEEDHNDITIDAMAGTAKYIAYPAFVALNKNRSLMYLLIYANAIDYGYIISTLHTKLNTNYITRIIYDYKIYRDIQVILLFFIRAAVHFSTTAVQEDIKHYMKINDYSAAALQAYLLNIIYNVHSYYSSIYLLGKEIQYSSAALGLVEQSAVSPEQYLVTRERAIQMLAHYSSQMIPNNIPFVIYPYNNDVIKLQYTRLGITVETHTVYMTSLSDYTNIDNKDQVEQTLLKYQIAEKQDQVLQTALENTIKTLTTLETNAAATSAEITVKQAKLGTISLPDGQTAYDALVDEIKGHRADFININAEMEALMKQHGTIENIKEEIANVEHRIRSTHRLVGFFSLAHDIILAKSSPDRSAEVPNLEHDLEAYRNAYVDGTDQIHILNALNLPPTMPEQIFSQIAPNLYVTDHMLITSECTSNALFSVATSSTTLSKISTNPLFLDDVYMTRFKAITSMYVPLFYNKYNFETLTSQELSDNTTINQAGTNTYKAMLYYNPQAQILSHTTQDAYKTYIQSHSTEDIYYYDGPKDTATATAPPANFQVLVDFRTRDLYTSTYNRFIMKLLNTQFTHSLQIPRAQLFTTVAKNENVAPNLPFFIKGIRYLGMYSQIDVNFSLYKIDAPIKLADIIDTDNAYGNILVALFRSALINIMEYLYNTKIASTNAVKTNFIQNININAERFNAAFQIQTALNIAQKAKMYKWLIPHLPFNYSLLDAAMKIITDKSLGHYVTGGSEYDRYLWFYDKEKLKSVYVGEQVKACLQELGYIRYNTMLVRSIIWFIQLIRVIRLEIAHQLLQLKDPYVSGISLANIDLTEEDL